MGANILLALELGLAQSSAIKAGSDEEKDKEVVKESNKEPEEDSKGEDPPLIAAVGSHLLNKGKVGQFLFL